MYQALLGSRRCDDLFERVACFVFFSTAFWVWHVVCSLWRVDESVTTCWTDDPVFITTMGKSVRAIYFFLFIPL